MVMLIAQWALWQFRRAANCARGSRFCDRYSNPNNRRRAVARYYAVIGGEHYVPAPKGTSE